LAKYVNTYYKLKAPKEIDCRQQVIEAISRTIYEISQLAIDKEEHDVVQFLHKYSNEIIERTMRIRK
jgi:ferritin